MEPRMYVVQEPAFLFRDRVRNIPTYLPVIRPLRSLLAYVLHLRISRSIMDHSELALFEDPTARETTYKACQNGMGE